MTRGAWPRTAHRQRLAELHRCGVLAAAGSWDHDSGALLIFRLDESGARAEIAADPYYTAPGVQIVGIRAWAPVVGLCPQAFRPSDP